MSNPALTEESFTSNSRSNFNPHSRSSSISSPSRYGSCLTSHSGTATAAPVPSPPASALRVAAAVLSTDSAIPSPPASAASCSGDLRSFVAPLPVPSPPHLVIDHIAQEMNARFSEANTQLLTCIGALDPNNSFANYSESKLVQLAELYPEDFSEHDRNNLVVELEMWISNMRENVAYSTIQDIGDLAKKMVEGGFHKAFHLVYRLIELVLVLPVATASVERAFSAMSLVKSDLRNRMGDEYLSDALVCKIEKDVFKRVDNEVILQHFQNMKTRKMLLPPLPLK